MVLYTAGARNHLVRKGRVVPNDAPRASLKKDGKALTGFSRERRIRRSPDFRQKDGLGAHRIFEKKTEKAPAGFWRERRKKILIGV